MTMEQGYEVGETDQRPWGRWTVLAAGGGYIIKRIEVEPGQILSLQRHQYRAEHWVILEGEAEVTIGDQTMQKAKQDAALIPIAAVHRIANVGSGPLVFIEVQLGDRLEESDIVRLEDSYGRS